MSNRLPILAGIANTAHDRAATALRTAAEAAREAGDALLEAKATVDHGEWSAWLKENFRGGLRTAQRYMRIAKNWPDIEAKTTCVSDLSVNEALRLLDGRSELERALVQQAEMDALGEEMKLLRDYVDGPDVSKEGLIHVIDRSQEAQGELVEIKGRAVREVGRLMGELKVSAENYRSVLPASAADYMIRKLREIDARISVSPAGMELPEDLTFEQWEAVGKVFVGAIPDTTAVTRP